MQNVAERAGGLSVRCQGLVHLYKTFEGHDVVALQGVECRGVHWWVDLGGQLIFHITECVTRFEPSRPGQRNRCWPTPPGPCSRSPRETQPIPR